MPNYTYGYFLIKKKVTVLAGTIEAKTDGYYYIKLRLEKALLLDKKVRDAVNLLVENDLTEKQKAATRELEKNFRCAATKGLVAHIRFTLVNDKTEADVYPKWGNRYDTSLTYDRSLTLIQVQTNLLSLTFSPGDPKYVYKIDPESFYPKAEY